MAYLNDKLASDAVAIGAGSDTAQYDLVGFYVGGAGNVTVVTHAGTTVTFTACPVGFALQNVGLSQIKATGTTATNIVGLKR